MAKHVAKTQHQLVSALEDHLFLVAECLFGLQRGDAAFIRELSAKLRALICSSAGLDGLLWRVCAATGTDDTVQIRYPGAVDTTNPLTRGLEFVFAPVAPDGSGDERVPLCTWSFREHIKSHEALFINGVSVTHHELIKELADRAGVAHEADSISKLLSKINDHTEGDLQPCFSILDSDARVALEVGERAIQNAVTSGYSRRRLRSVPPSLKSLPSLRFAQLLDLPKANVGPLPEGTAFFFLDVGRPDSRAQGRRFPRIASSGIAISTMIKHMDRLSISIEGLPVTWFSCECVIPADSDEPLPIVVTWKGRDVRVYVVGEQVAGNRS